MCVCVCARARALACMILLLLLVPLAALIFALQVCKHFLHAIEEGKYGWFWECPSGEKCIYRHALPPGFVFKTKKAPIEDEGPQITVEQLVEDEVGLELSSCLSWCKYDTLSEREANFIWEGPDQSNLREFYVMEEEKSVYCKFMCCLVFYKTNLC